MGLAVTPSDNYGMLPLLIYCPEVYSNESEGSNIGLDLHASRGLSTVKSASHLSHKMSFLFFIIYTSLSCFWQRAGLSFSKRELLGEMFT